MPYDFERRQDSGIFAPAAVPKGLQAVRASWYF